MHWMRGCREIIPSIDAHTTSLIYVAAKNIREDDDRVADMGMADIFELFFPRQFLLLDHGWIGTGIVSSVRSVLLTVHYIKTIIL